MQLQRSFQSHERMGSRQTQPNQQSHDRQQPRPFTASNTRLPGQHISARDGVDTTHLGSARDVTSSPSGRHARSASAGRGSSPGIRLLDGLFSRHKRPDSASPQPSLPSLPPRQHSVDVLMGRDQFLDGAHQIIKKKKGVLSKLKGAISFTSQSKQQTSLQQGPQLPASYTAVSGEDDISTGGPMTRGLINARTASPRPPTHLLRPSPQQLQQPLHADNLQAQQQHWQQHQQQWQPQQQQMQQQQLPPQQHLPPQHHPQQQQQQQQGPDTSSQARYILQPPSQQQQQHAPHLSPQSQHLPELQRAVQAQAEQLRELNECKQRLGLQNTDLKAAREKVRGCPRIAG